MKKSITSKFLRVLGLGLGAIFICGGGLSERACAQTYGDSGHRRAPSSRWTLEEWLRQKERNRLMDQWLALNSSSAYEFFVAGRYLSSVTESSATQFLKKNDQVLGAEIGAYASIVGLEARHERFQESDISATEFEFHVRILGTSLQSTHLGLHYGLKVRNEGGDELKQQVPGVTLTVYLLKHFGLSGSYRMELPSESEAGHQREGFSAAGEAFIDFEQIRIFGRANTEQSQVRLRDGLIGDTRQEIRLDTLGAGLKIFF